MSDKPPMRPNTPPEEAMLAMERLLLLVLTKTAESSGNAAQTVDGWRVGLLKGFEDSGDPADQSRRLVTDHADYLLALVELQLRRKAARG